MCNWLNPSVIFLFFTSFFFFKEDSLRKKPNVLYIFTTNDEENKFTLLHQSSQMCEPQVGKCALLT